MKLKITLLAVFAAAFFANAQVAPTLQHNNLDVNNTSEGPMDIAVYNNEMYLSMVEDGKIVKISLATPNAPVVDVVTGLNYPTGMAVVGTDLYYLQASNAIFSPNAGSLSKISLTAATPIPTVIATGLQYPIEIAMNGTVPYITENFLNADGDDALFMQLSVLNGSVKTVLNSSFDYIEDIEYYDNAIYILQYSSGDDDVNIVKYNLVNNPTNAVQPFWNDPTNIVPYKMTVSGTKMYLNADSSPASIRQIDMVTPAAAAVQMVTPFQFNGNTGHYVEMIMAPGNMLYAIGESYDVGLDTDHYLLYKADLSTLSNKEFETNKTTVYPNPTKDVLSIAIMITATALPSILLKVKRYWAGSTTAVLT